MLPLEETGYTQDLSVLFLTTAWESTSTSKQKIIITILLQKTYTHNIDSFCHERQKKKKDPKTFQWESKNKSNTKDQE